MLKKPIKPVFYLPLAIPVIAVVVALRVSLQLPSPFSWMNQTWLGKFLFKSDVAAGATSFFVSEFPRESRFRDELDQLRRQGKLDPKNEDLIQQSVSKASHKLAIPQALLWCLLFQESRLNHLEGIDGDSGARGLGQFSYFSFFEVNHHLDKFSPQNRSLMLEILGSDIRPVQPRKDARHPSSYFYIPTAVITSAAFLNNRYHQLERTLNRKSIVFDPELLWLYAAIAYNKGNRSVLSIWNDTQRRFGTRQVEKLVLELPSLITTTTDPTILTRSLRRIWPSSTAKEYAKELRIHIENLRDCSLKNEFLARAPESFK